MCCKQSSCQHREKEVGEPEKCSPERIAECHPESEIHSCAE